MYDLVPPSMKAQFNLINLPNQRIKLHVNIDEKLSSKKRLSNYSYNNNIIFKYSIDIDSSYFKLIIFPTNSKKNHFNKTIIGSFIYDTSIKYSVTEINVNTKNKSILDALVYGFL